MDCRPFYSLAVLRRRRRFHRSRLQCHLSAVYQLPRRHLYNLCRFGGFCKHIPSELNRWRLAFGSQTDVHSTRRWACNEYLGWSRRARSACSFSLHEVRVGTQEEVQVCPGTRLSNSYVKDKIHFSTSNLPPNLTLSRIESPTFRTNLRVLSEGCLPSSYPAIEVLPTPHGTRSQGK